MAVYNKFYQYAQDVIEAKHNFASDVFKVLLTNTAPLVTNQVRADLAEVAAGNGYAAGGLTVPVVVSITLGTAKVTGTNVNFTASGGTIGPFRYAVFYNDTAAGDPLISWWDYGTSITLNDTEQFTVAFDPANGIFDQS